MNNPCMDHSYMYILEKCVSKISLCKCTKALWCNRCSTSLVNIFSTKKKFADLINDNGNDNVMSVFSQMKRCQPVLVGLWQKAHPRKRAMKTRVLMPLVTEGPQRGDQPWDSWWIFPSRRRVPTRPMT